MKQWLLGAVAFLAVFSIVRFVEWRQKHAPITTVDGYLAVCSLDPRGAAERLADPMVTDAEGTPLLSVLIDRNDVQAIWCLLDRFREHVGFNGVSHSVDGNWSTLFEQRDAQGKTALHHAAFKEDAGTVHLIMSQPVGMMNTDATDKLGRTPLHYAAMAKSDYVGNILTSFSQWTNVKDKNGETPAHIWVRFHKDKEVWPRYLSLKWGEPHDKLGRTPLMLAIELGQVDTAMAISREDADPDARDNKGMTPRQLAARKFHGDDLVNLVDAWIRSNAREELNARDALGRTPLIKAVDSRDFHVALALSKAGANPNLTDKRGRTARERARATWTGAQYAELYEAWGGFCFNTRWKKTHDVDLTDPNRSRAAK